MHRLTLAWLFAQECWGGKVLQRFPFLGRGRQEEAPRRMPRKCGRMWPSCWERSAFPDPSALLPAVSLMPSHSAPAQDRD